MEYGLRCSPPFHECTHQTAFKSAWLNSLGAWLSGFPFGMAPAVYRAFHFDHHRYTQYPDKDPELLFLGGQPVSWPTRWKNWLLMMSGLGPYPVQSRRFGAFSFAGL